VPHRRHGRPAGRRRHAGRVGRLGLTDTTAHRRGAVRFPGGAFFIGLASGRVGFSRVVTVRDALASWQPLYLTAGAAAATLVGLLFVGLSLHIRVVVAQPDVRSLARVTLTEFFVVLLVALALLQPTDSSAQVGYWLVAISVISGVLIVRPVVDGVRSGGGRIGSSMLIARFGVSALSFLGLAVA